MFYVKDQTINKLVTFENYPSVVRHLEGTVQRLKKQTRAEFMNDMVALGHGYDDNDGVQFVKLLAEAVEMGVLRGNRQVRCDLCDVAMFNKPEFGD